MHVRSAGQVCQENARRARHLGPQASRRLAQKLLRLARDLGPGREHDAVSVPAGHAPFLVVVFIVGGVVVPATAVSLEDGGSSFEREVESIRATVPKEGKLPNEVVDAVRDEEPPGLHLQRRPRRVLRVEFIEETRSATTPAAPRPPEPLDPRQSRHRSESTPTRVFAHDFEGLRVEYRGERDERRLDTGDLETSSTSRHQTRAAGRFGV